MRAYNSTIRIKQKECVRCGFKRPIFSRGRCQKCSVIEDTLARDEEENEKEEGFMDLVKELDDVISLYLRRSNADENGLVQCYTCPERLPVGQMQAGHYIPRGNMLLRFDIERNLRCQCKGCNEYGRGRLAIYGQRLEKEMPGITDVLQEESGLSYKYSRDELRNLIIHYKKKLKSLKR